MPALPVGAHLVGAFFLRGDTQVPTRRQWSMMPKGITNHPGLLQPQEPAGHAETAPCRRRRLAELHWREDGAGLQAAPIISHLFLGHT